jgi:RimJ/RimL family protein N-acetyltransferase
LLLKEALDSSLAELQMWVPWAVREPSPLESLQLRLAGMRSRFVAGEDWTFGVFDSGASRVLGGAGLHPRGDADTLSIGYWIRTDATGQGLATEAAAALCDTAFECCGIERVEIRCDAQNHRSAAIPRRLGFRLTTSMRERSITSHGAERETLVWTLQRPEYLSGRLPSTPGRA